MFGSKNDREIKKLQPIVDKINGFEDAIKKLTDDQLKAKTQEFRDRYNNNESLDDMLPEAFAVCREAAWRVLGMRHYDVQMIGGIILHSGSIAEMRTGEGKTLVATLATYLNGITGKGVHVITVNDYLASRDEEWMGQLYRWLGLTTGTIVAGKTDQERKEAYGADITYGTNNEFGFDYLRDNMKFDIENYVQKKLNYAIIDECDSILVDEARTPLIISGPSEESVDKYYDINKLIPKLIPEVDFTMEEKSKSVSLTEEGNNKCEELLAVGNLFEPQNIGLLHFIYQGLKAHHLFKKDIDYMIKDNEIVIIDEFTGRLMDGRRWSEGLHQAVEAKEGVTIKSENQTLATITFQNYFRMYEKLSGMTGTAETEAVEFKKIYELSVFVIPTNKPIARLDEDDEVYKTENAKFNAIADDIIDRKSGGQPVLVGTTSIEMSERISRALKNKGITHNVLNAKHHEKEAEIVAQAGRKNSVTIATNMAGRGTDIMLGGNPEFMARNEAGDNEESEAFKEAMVKYKAQCAAEKEEVKNTGGLYIIGTERHESRRIDNQLRGRAGRQGDPGESRFYLSLEDNLMRIFNGERIQKIMDKLNVPDDEPIVAGMVSRAIEGAQKKVEGHQFDIRKNLLDYDDVMNKQRHAIYKQRRQVLMGEDMDSFFKEMLGDVSTDILDTFASESVKTSNWDYDGMSVALAQQFGIEISAEDIHAFGTENLPEKLKEMVETVVEQQKKHMGPMFDQVQKMIFLETIDTRWKEHLAAIDQLKEGIHLRGYAQKDPLIEYKKESFKVFTELKQTIQSESVEKLLKVQLVDPSQAEALRQRQVNEQNLDYQHEEAEGISGLPFAAKQQEQSYNTNRGPGSDDGQQLNRAERRRREKSSKRKR